MERRTDFIRHCSNQNTFSSTLGTYGEGDGNGRLADPTLAGDDDQLSVEHPCEASEGRATAEKRYRMRREVERTRVAQLDVDKFLERFKERAAAVKDRGIPPIEGPGRQAFVVQAENDFLDYSLVGSASWAVEDDALVLRIPLG